MRIVESTQPHPNLWQAKRTSSEKSRSRFVRRNLQRGGGNLGYLKREEAAASHVSGGALEDNVKNSVL